MIELPDITTNKIAIKVKPLTETLIKKGHPWVFENSIIKQNKEGKAGDLAIIFDSKKNKFLACGFYDPESPIRIKILQRNKPTAINAAWFAKQVNVAFQKRIPLLQTNTNSYRLIFGENDNLPSIIADVYANVLVVKLYASFWFYHLKDILPILIEKSKATTTILRLSRTVQKTSNAFNLKDGQVLDGELKSEVVLFKEHGINFLANVIYGHKTGFFLDHRANRKKVGDMSKGKTVLDVFCYAGGFSIHALVGGAKTVTSIDISKPALEIAKRNAKQNQFAGKHYLVNGDAFEELNKFAKANKKFDIVVIDPPSFAKSSSEIEKALVSYKKLTYLGIKLVQNQGILVLASCSSRVRSAVFFDLVETILQKQKINYSIVGKTLHDLDHPIGFKEGAYLKCIYIQFNWHQ